jgi:hypothetical protein
MLFKTRNAAVYGIETYLVDVEVNLSTDGNGQFDRGTPSRSGDFTDSSLIDESRKADL